MFKKLLIGALLSFIFFFVYPRSLFAAIEFIISNPVNLNGEINVDVSLTGLTSQSCLNGKCYLQGAFQKSSGENYFGFTQNNSGDWYKYESSPSVDFILSTFFVFEPSNGSWSGSVKVRNDSEGGVYTGPGDYLLKFKRYSGKATSSSGDSNTLTINLTEPTPSPSPTPTPAPTTPTAASTATPTSTPTKTPTPTPTPTKSPSPTPTKSPSPTPTESPVEESPSTSTPTPGATVLAESTEKKGGILPYFLIGGGIVCLGFAGYFLYNRGSEAL